MTTTTSSVPQPKHLRVNDIVIPDKLPVPPFARAIGGKVVRVANDGHYDVQFDDAVIPMHRDMLSLSAPWLEIGDRVMIVPDPPEQVESLLRLSTTEEMASEVGIIRRVGREWGCRDEEGAIPENWGPHHWKGTHWYYEVEWPSGHRDHFLHTGDLCRVEE